jgi:undecaprenyl-diphosphatase
MNAPLDFLVRLDERLFLLINSRWWHEALDSPMEEVSTLGAWPIGLIVLALLAWEGRARLIRHAVVLAVAVLGFALCIHVIKSATERYRPARHFVSEIASGEVTIRFVERRVFLVKSMPSGHSAAAFCLMVYCALHRRGNRVALLGLATLIGYSRVYVGLHFPGDVLAGAALGSAWGWAAWWGYRFWARLRPLPPHTRTVVV